MPIRVSIHALLAESDLTSLFRPVKEQSFYPRSPCGERHTGQPVRGLPSCFYPRSPCGERLAAGTVCRQMQGFLSTLSLRRATQPPPLLIVELTSFYPRSPCGERHAKPWRKYHTADVSIHALLAESDARGPLRARAPEVSIHALLAESDATGTAGSLAEVAVSIHALLAESDAPWRSRTTAARGFLSTLSLRRATIVDVRRATGTAGFYPRSPCGERPSDVWMRRNIVEFLSTLSLRRATRGCAFYYPIFAVSIHALLAESDRFMSATNYWPPMFLSTLSLRRATQERRRIAKYNPVSIHALLAESDFRLVFAQAQPL